MWAQNRGLYMFLTWFLSPSPELSISDLTMFRSELELLWHHLSTFGLVQIRSFLLQAANCLTLTILPFSQFPSFDNLMITFLHSSSPTSHRSSTGHFFVTCLLFSPTLPVSKQVHPSLTKSRQPNSTEQETPPVKTVLPPQLI